MQDRVVLLRRPRLEPDSEKPVKRAQRWLGHVCIVVPEETAPERREICGHDRREEHAAKGQAARRSPRWFRRSGSCGGHHAPISDHRGKRVKYARLKTVSPVVLLQGSVEG